MKFTVIIVLASVLASYVSFISALARPKLSASRIQMTTKMSNGMAAKIKTMAGLMTAGLMAVSTPAWGRPSGIIAGTFTGIKLPTDVKLTFTTDPAFLSFQCPNDASLPGLAYVYAPNVQVPTDKRSSIEESKYYLENGYYTCTASRVEVFLPDPADPASNYIAGRFLLDPVFTSPGGAFKIYTTGDGFWTIK